ncbi:hypothetical protein HBH70_151670 [Parastagonospora nodorum]|nr:hypothetical protein HBH53_167260 [Parastagonospora nodorum]KAH3965479.1 hypothetical protein HBH51_150980 [Parastagonospora nodorum]KAH4000277.1 hypothetical protein HBI10_110500 [Parastagonospora nodorum]KAH4022141.1 hypothetical protein HBI13_098710 [Parastagonospora nodorum]KAH4027858.1 hypothetical protein HBI09_144140 [Parastagonospora nodorum]
MPTFAIRGSESVWFERGSTTQHTTDPLPFNISPAYKIFHSRRLNYLSWVVNVSVGDSGPITRVVISTKVDDEPRNSRAWIVINRVYERSTATSERWMIEYENETGIGDTELFTRPWPAGNNSIQWNEDVDRFAFEARWDEEGEGDEDEE